jgi:uncharacterized protein
VLRGVDRAAFAVSLASRLRASGLEVAPTSVGDFVRALAASPPDAKSRLYWAARITLVRRQSELAAFDAAFAAVFDGALVDLSVSARSAPLPTASGDAAYLAAPAELTAGQAGAGLPWATLPPAVSEAAGTDSALTLPERLPSDVAGLAGVPFEQLTPGQAALLGRWVEAALGKPPTRPSRRVRVDRRGHRPAIRATIARARRTGWEPIHLVTVKPVDKARRVVMLCDVSQSMQAQAAAYLHLMRALVIGSDAEVFAFATTYTRLTSVLAHRSAEVAIDQASVKVVDRFGGTRIATNVQHLLSSLHGGLLRGAVVVIASDGWDSDSPESLAAAMARLKRRAHRVIWINPRAAAPGYLPLVATMAAALPYCDAFLPADTFAALRDVVDEIARRPGRDSAVRTRG